MLFHTLPQSVFTHIRNVFSNANTKITKTVSQQPNLHEPHLDQLLVSGLTEFGGPYVVQDKDKWVVTVQAEMFGGHRLYGLWEVADIAFFISIRHKKIIQKVKVGLLQSKRLYPREIKNASKFPLTAIDRAFLHNKPEKLGLWERSKLFHFDESCKYLAALDKQQVEAIQGFYKKSNIPVDYLLYNPWQIPFNIRLPQTSIPSFGSSPSLGMRVVYADIVNKFVQINNKAPSFRDVKEAFAKLQQNQRFGFDEPGWRIENWVSDLLLSCKLGYLADDYKDENITTYLFGRNRPISAAVSVAIDAPKGFGEFSNMSQHESR